MASYGNDLNQLLTIAHIPVISAGDPLRHAGMADEVAEMLSRLFFLFFFAVTQCVILYRFLLCFSGVIMCADSECSVLCPLGISYSRI